VQQEFAGSIVEAAIVVGPGSSDSGESHIGSAYPGLGFAGSGSFLRMPFGYLPGRNIERVRSITASQCAMRCLADQFCKSFDAERSKQFGPGDCYLSYNSVADADREGLSSSASFDYFESRLG
jgi:hypothetical protein